MEKEELVEMINSTINTNGSGAITGEALNLALQAIVETMGTGSGSGAERLQGYFDGSAWVQTDEEKALNAQLYTKWSAMIANEENVVSLMKCVIESNTMFGQSTLCANIGGMIMFYFVLDGLMSVVLSSDGTITARIGG